MCPQGVNLPAALLEHLGFRTIDLLVLSHPDLDHLQGLASLVERFSPKWIWRCPFGGYLRDLVAAWCGRDSPNQQYFKELRRALDAIESYTEELATTVEASFSTRPWPPAADADYEVQCLAPTSYDQGRIRRLWKRLVDVPAGGEPRLTGMLRRMLKGEARFSLPANALSLALALQWRGRKVLLSGDVENGNRSPHSGWKGVLAHAEQNGLRGLMRELDLVKVAHHGSLRSFHEPAWEQHKRSDGATAAVICPFTRTALPVTQVLRRLSSYCGRLGITSCEQLVLTRVEAAGWKQQVSSLPEALAPCIAAVLPSSGGVQLFASGAAMLFTPGAADSALT